LPQGTKLRSQIFLPLKSQQPIFPLALVKQTDLPSVTGVGEVESLYAYIMGLSTDPSSRTDHSSLPVFASKQCPRIVALNLGEPGLYFGEGGEEEAVSPNGNAALASIDQRRAPEDVLIERGAPPGRSKSVRQAPGVVRPPGLRPLSAENRGCGENDC
jgi:hypothetical protein